MRAICCQVKPLSFRPSPGAFRIAYGYLVRRQGEGGNLTHRIEGGNLTHRIENLKRIANAQNPFFSSSLIDQPHRSASVGTWVFKVGAEPPSRSIRPSAPYPSWRETPGGFAREGSQTRAWGRAHSRGGRSFVIQPGRLSPREAEEQSLVTAAGRTRAEYRSAREGSPGWGGRHDVA